VNRTKEVWTLGILGSGKVDSKYTQKLEHEKHTEAVSTRNKPRAALVAVEEEERGEGALVVVVAVVLATREVSGSS